MAKSNLRKRRFIVTYDSRALKSLIKSGKHARKGRRNSRSRQLESAHLQRQAQSKENGLKIRQGCILRKPAPRDTLQEARLYH